MLGMLKKAGFVIPSTLWSPWRNIHLQTLDDEKIFEILWKFIGSQPVNNH